MITTNKVKACMIGDSVFKIGDYTSIAQGWSLYKDKLSLNECISFKIIELKYNNTENSNLPKFIAKVQTNKGNIVEISVSDLDDVRNVKENREELNKVGYNFEEETIYSKGYEKMDGKWEFFKVGELQYTNCI